VTDLRELLEDVADPATFTVDAPALVARGRARRRRRTAVLTIGSACVVVALAATTFAAIDDPAPPADVDTGPAPTVADTSTTAAPTTTTTAPAPTTTTTSPLVELGPPPDLEAAGLQVVGSPVAPHWVDFTMSHSGTWVAGPTPGRVPASEVHRVEDQGFHQPIVVDGTVTALDVIQGWAWVATGGDGEVPMIRRIEAETYAANATDDIPSVDAVAATDVGPVGAVDLAAVGGRVWASDTSTSPHRLLLVDAESVAVFSETPIQGRLGDLVATEQGSVWVQVGAGGGTPSRLELHDGSGEPVAHVAEGLLPIARVGESDVWAVGTNELVRVSPDGVVARIPVPGIQRVGGPGSPVIPGVWIATADGLEHRDLETGALLRAFPWPDGWDPGDPVRSVVGTHRGVWAASEAGVLVRWPGTDTRMDALVERGRVENPWTDFDIGFAGEQRSYLRGRWEDRVVGIGIVDGLTRDEMFPELPADSGETRTTTTIAGVDVVVTEFAATFWTWQTGDRQFISVSIQRAPDAPPLDIPTEVLVEQLIRATVPSATAPG
jgi:hypothetical protein